MSNGWTILANVETDGSFVMVRECWGSYAPDHQRTIEVTDGHTSIFITAEQMRDLIDQVQLTKADLAAEVAGGLVGRALRYPRASAKSRDRALEIGQYGSGKNFGRNK